LKRAVVDQPGLRIVFLGLIVAAFLGLSLKSYIQPHKLRARFDKTIQRLNPDVRIDFQRAQIVLSDWGWPQPYLTVENIRLTPVRPLCDDSQIYIESVTFPLTWNVLFAKNKNIRSLRLSQVEVRVSDFKNCFQSQGNEDPYQIFNVKSSSELKQVKIDQIKFISKKLYSYPLYLQSVNLNFHYQDSLLKSFDLKGQLLALKAQDRPIFKIKSDLVMNVQNDHDEVDPLKKIKAQIQIQGRLFDKKYTTDMMYYFKTKELDSVLNFEGVSLKSLYSLFNGTEFKNYFSFWKTDAHLISGQIASRVNLSSAEPWVLDLKSIQFQSPDSANPITGEIKLSDPVQFKLTGDLDLPSVHLKKMEVVGQANRYLEPFEFNLKSDEAFIKQADKELVDGEFRQALLQIKQRLEDKSVMEPYQMKVSVHPKSPYVLWDLSFHAGNKDHHFILNSNEQLNLFKWNSDFK